MVLLLFAQFYIFIVSHSFFKHFLVFKVTGNLEFVLHMIWFKCFLI